MPRGHRMLIKNACYHVIARGNHKEKVFSDAEDYNRFISTLKRYKKKYEILIFAFCFMPNHIHIVTKPKDAKKLSKFMHCLLRSYTAHFNKKYNKVGQLWQGRFKSKIITQDNYVIDCINYIEGNPVRADIVKSPADFIWSSYRERILDETSNIEILDPIEI